MTGNVKMKIKKNDSVVVIAGKDKGKTGVVKSVFPKEQRAIVLGVNMAIRHTRPSQTNPQGGRLSIEAPIHVSNIALVDPKDKKPTRVGYKKIEGDKKVRFAKKSGEMID
jgi:large subunit ribosomal protein L24